MSVRVAPPLVLHRTLPAPCPYLQGRIEQRLVVALEGVAEETFDKLSRTAGIVNMYEAVKMAEKLAKPLKG